MHYKLAPSLLAANFSHLGDDIAAVSRAGAHYIHFDVMDGCFVPNISFGTPVLGGIRPLTALPFDVHLMVERPSRLLDLFAQNGADILNVHMEAADDIPACVRRIHALGKKAAVTLKPGTPVAAVYPLAEETDMVLLMSVEPGFGGQAFLPETLRKAETLAGFAIHHGLSFDIEMDGGIGLNNVRPILDAGVNVVVVGSALFAGAVTETEARTRALLAILEERA